MTQQAMDYQSPVPTYALAFSPLSTSSSVKLALGSYLESDGNSLSIIASPSKSTSVDDYSTGYGLGIGSSKQTPAMTMREIAKTQHPYPPSCVGFSPERLSESLRASNQAHGGGEGTREMVATSSDCLRLFDLVGDDAASNGGKGFVGREGKQAGMRLVMRALLANTKENYSAPLTAFSWSTIEPTKIATSSIDTVGHSAKSHDVKLYSQQGVTQTCTIWDIATSVPVTQLIAHDREVYDVSWSPTSRDTFASVGADGSVRMFDLRSLEHSTILYEATTPTPASNGETSANKGVSPPSTTPTPLLRLSFSPTSPTYLAVAHADSPEVIILDTRSAGHPVMVIKGHSGSVNGMAWRGNADPMTSVTAGGGGSSGPGHLATCADDSTVLLYDLSNPLPLPQTPRNQPPVPKIVSTPDMWYPANGEVNAVAWGGGGEWIAAGCGSGIKLLRV